MEKKKILYDLAKSYLHTPYRWGGDDVSGIDCSGFLVELLKAFGIVAGGYDGTAKDLFNSLKARPGSAMVPSDSFGDIVFFGSDLSSISHVALCLGSGLIIEAGGGGRDTTSSDKAFAKNAFVRIRPLKHRSDRLEIMHIDWGF